MNEIALAARVLVALVFLAAAAGKMRHRSEFEGVVANYRLVPPPLVPAFALLLPPAELAVAAALLFISGPWAAFAAALLLLVFAAAMAINLGRGRRHIDCGCFQSVLKQPLKWTLVVRNAGLAALLVLPALQPTIPVAVDEAMQSLLIGVVLFILLQALNILWSVVPAWQVPRAASTGANK